MTKGSDEQEVLGQLYSEGNTFEGNRGSIVEKGLKRVSRDLYGGSPEWT